MRFIIDPLDGSEPLILNDTANNQTIGWYLVDSVVEGWYGTPALRETPFERYGMDGDAPPSRKTQGARHVSIYGALEAQSTIESTSAIDSINAIFGKDLRITGEDANGARHIKGYLADDPMPTFLPGEKLVKFSLVFTCPYPIKSGDDVAYPVSNGRALVRNGGNAQAWPKLKVEGTVTSASVSYMGHSVTWRGNADSLCIDLFDLSCTSGEIVTDDAFSVPPGDSSIYVSVSGGDAQVVLADAWR